VPFTVRVTEVQELERGGDPAGVAIENALRKVRAARRAEHPEALLGCDTIVVLDGVIYGKPLDEAHARRTLSALLGRTHEVISGLALSLAGEERTALSRTRVTFRAIEPAMLERYIATGEWRGRSGGYAIQGAGATLAVAIDGPQDNVVGLPVGALLELYPELLER